MNVLVVQDDARIASFIRRGLEAEGFAVRTATDGAEGLRLTESSDFDLIILDLVLPTVTSRRPRRRIRTTFRRGSGMHRPRCEHLSAICASPRHGAGRRSRTRKATSRTGRTKLRLQAGL